MMENKIKLIDEIVKRHPSYGVEKGWSYYVGGMKDTGDWYFRKMLDVPTEELQAFLDEIIKGENAPKKVLSEEDLIKSKTYISLPNSGFTNVLQRDILDEYFKRLEDDLWFGDSSYKKEDNGKED